MVEGGLGSSGTQKPRGAYRGETPNSQEQGEKHSPGMGSVSRDRHQEAGEERGRTFQQMARRM